MRTKDLTISQVEELISSLEHKIEILESQVTEFQRTAKIDDGTDGINYETQSIQSAVIYNQSAIGEMNIDELDQLKAKNAKRIAEIEATYFKSKREIKAYGQVVHQLKEEWSTKEQYKDSSTSYPTYGRGLEP